MTSHPESDDPDKVLAEYLNNARAAAEKTKNHKLGQWKFENAPDPYGYLVVARCSECNAPARVTILRTGKPETFPPPKEDTDSAALRYKCINVKKRRQFSAASSGERSSINPSAVR
jgi:hypothetical protein